jgi:hypothetical protein
MIEPVRDDVKGILLAKSPSAIDAKIDAGPIVSEDWRRSGGGLGGHG